MKDKNYSQAGIGILEVVIVAGLLGFLALMVMNLSDLGMRSTRQLSSTTDWVSLRQQLSFAFQSVDDCKNALQDSDGTSPALNTDGTEIHHIHFFGTNILESGQRIGDYEIESIKLDFFSPDYVESVWNEEKVKNYKARLNIFATRIGQSMGGAQRSIDDIFLHIITDENDRILSCSTNAPQSGELMLEQVVARVRGSKGNIGCNPQDNGLSWNRDPCKDWGGQAQIKSKTVSSSVANSAVIARDLDVGSYGQYGFSCNKDEGWIVSGCWMHQEGGVSMSGPTGANTFFDVDVRYMENGCYSNDFFQLERPVTLVGSCIRFVTSKANWD